MAPNSNVPDGLSRPGELRCSAGHLGGKPRARNGKARARKPERKCASNSTFFFLSDVWQNRSTWPDKIPGEEEDKI